MKIIYFNQSCFVFALFLFCFGINLICCKKVLFIDMLNGININYFKKNINKHSTSHETCANSRVFFNKNSEGTKTAKDVLSLPDNNEKENVLKQYIYTLSHLANFDIDRGKKIPLNISLLIKACLASHNYIKNVEIYTSQVSNKDACSFIYENAESFDHYFNLHISKYSEYFNNSSDLTIKDMLKTYITDNKLLEEELYIYQKIKKENSKHQNNILLDILFECTRLNKIIQYSLAVNSLHLFSYHVTYKIFLYFKKEGIYYDILLHNFHKIKYFYQTQNIKEEDKMKINAVVDNYLLLFKHMDDLYEQTKIL